MPLEAELLLDGARAFIHVLRWDACSLTPLLEELRQTHGASISFQDRSKPAEKEHGCSSCGSDGGCGSGGEGGCSTGGCSNGDCSRGGVKSAAELTAYFAALREQMHARELVPLV